jgi:hypothetical protein
MRGEQTVSQAKVTDSVVLPDLGAPKLPTLVNGRPVDGDMVVKPLPPMPTTFPNGANIAPDSTSAPAIDLTRPKTPVNPVPVQ